MFCNGAITSWVLFAKAMQKMAIFLQEQDNVLKIFQKENHFYQDHMSAQDLVYYGYCPRMNKVQTVSGSVVTLAIIITPL